MSTNLNDELREYAEGEGADLVGVADLNLISPEQNQVNGTYPWVVIAAIRLSQAILDEITDHPTKTYYHHYRMVNMALDQLGLSITRFLQSKGHLAFPVPASQLVDWENQKGIFSHKHGAVAAGLGWIGRNNLLVTPQYGSQIRLVSILTDASLEPSAPLTADCGSCRACLDVCPAQAIADDPHAFDHQLCYRRLDWFVKKRIVGQHICGVCVRACSPAQVVSR
jgi:epoxyqueuosine reductase QueG